MAEIQSADGTLSNTQKAAILLTLMGEKEATEMLKMLAPTDIQKLTEAMLSIADVNQDEVHDALDSFIISARTQTGIGHGARTYVRNVLKGAIGDQNAQMVLNRLTPDQMNRQPKTLDWLDADSIVQTICHEHPQVIAAILAHLQPEIAAQAIQLLPNETQSDIVLRIATLQDVHPEAIAELDNFLQIKRQGGNHVKLVQLGGTAFAAQIMNNFSRGADQKIIEDLEVCNNDLWLEIQDQMLVFDNLSTLDDKGLQSLMRAIDSALLVAALKGADEHLRQRMLACMSQRAAQSVLDDMDARGPIRVSEVQEAQKQILVIARQMADEGQIMFSGKGDDYV